MVFVIEILPRASFENDPFLTIREYDRQRLNINCNLNRRLRSKLIRTHIPGFDPDGKNHLDFRQDGVHLSDNGNHKLAKAINRVFLWWT